LTLVAAGLVVVDLVAYYLSAAWDCHNCTWFQDLVIGAWFPLLALLGGLVAATAATALLRRRRSPEKPGPNSP
jgi:hypothetical protein